MMSKLYIYCFFLLLCSYVIPAQNNSFDSISVLLKTNKPDSIRVQYYIQLSDLCDINDILSYTKPATEIATKNLKKNTLSSTEIIFYKMQLGLAYNNMGYYYNNNGDVSLALLYFNNCLKMQEQINDKEGLVYTLINIAALYHSQDESGINNNNKESMFHKAIEYYTRSLNLSKEIDNKDSEARCLNNIGLVYDDLGEWKKALQYYDQSLTISLQFTDMKESTATSYNNMGYVYQVQALKFTGNSKDSLNKLALDAYEKAYILLKEINASGGIVFVLQNIGLIYLDRNDFTKATSYANQALSIAKTINSPEHYKRVYYLFYDIYKRQKNGNKALEMHELYIHYRDSNNNLQTRNAAIRSQFKYNFDKKESEINAEKEKIQLQASEDKKRQNIIIYSVVLGLILACVFSIFIFKGLQKNKRANKIILSQKHLVEEKQKEILDSITYAKRIQNAILPPKEYINTYLPDNFILYKPKDIVAGDFYWMENVDNITFIAAADSTGHGVPGAMVSVVCSNALNRAVLEFGLREPGKLLDKTTDIVLETFAKSGEEIKDGMDISLLAINHLNQTISWSGANNTLWYINNSGNELIEIKANKQPIGKSDYRTSFTTHSIPYQKGTVFYLMTDGYVDQFGGTKGKKFKYKQLEQLIKNNAHMQLKQQELMLNKVFEEWKGILEQVDDVTIIGIRV